MIFKLKKHFPDYYKKTSCYLYLATLGLCIPLLIRGFNSVMVLFPKTGYVKWSGLHNNLFNLLFFVTSTLVPSVFQISSLVFGLLRSKSDKKNKTKNKNEPKHASTGEMNY